MPAPPGQSPSSSPSRTALRWEPGSGPRVEEQPPLLPRHAAPPLAQRRLERAAPLRGSRVPGGWGPCPPPRPRALPRPRGALPPPGSEDKGTVEPPRADRAMQCRPHSPLQHQDEGEPCGNLAESGAMQTLEPRCGHSMAGALERSGAGGRLLAALQRRRSAHNSHLKDGLPLRAGFGRAGLCGQPPFFPSAARSASHPPGFPGSRLAQASGVRRGPAGSNLWRSGSAVGWKDLEKHPLPTPSTRTGCSRPHPTWH